MTRRLRADFNLSGKAWCGFEIPTNRVGFSGECTEDVLLVYYERDVVVGRVAAATPKSKFRKKCHALVERCEREQQFVAHLLVRPSGSRIPKMCHHVKGARRVSLVHARDAGGNWLACVHAGWEGVGGIPQTVRHACVFDALQLSQVKIIKRGSRFLQTSFATLVADLNRMPFCPLQTALFQVRTAVRAIELRKNFALPHVFSFVARHVP